MQSANRRIYETAQSAHEQAGMGTTLTAAYLDDADLAVAHVGDSRAYIFRDGSLTRLTQDHSLVEELVRRGKLTEEQAAEHPQRSIITRALGIENDVEVDTWTFPVRAGDVVLMCSDGLTSMIGEDQIAAVAELGARPRPRRRAADRRGQRGRRARQHHRRPVPPGGTDRPTGDGAGDQPTEVGLAVPRDVGSADRSVADGRPVIAVGERHPDGAGAPAAPARVVATDARSAAAARRAPRVAARSPAAAGARAAGFSRSPR